MATLVAGQAVSGITSSPENLLITIGGFLVIGGAIYYVIANGSLISGIGKGAGSVITDTGGAAVDVVEKAGEAGGTLLGKAWDGLENMFGANGTPAVAKPREAERMIGYIVYNDDCEHVTLKPMPETVSWIESEKNTGTYVEMDPLYVNTAQQAKDLAIAKQRCLTSVAHIDYLDVKKSESIKAVQVSLLAKFHAQVATQKLLTMTREDVRLACVAAQLDATQTDIMVRTFGAMIDDANGAVLSREQDAKPKQQGLGAAYVSAFIDNWAKAIYAAGAAGKPFPSVPSAQDLMAARPQPTPAELKQMLDGVEQARQAELLREQLVAAQKATAATPK